MNEVASEPDAVLTSEVFAEEPQGAGARLPSGKQLTRRIFSQPDRVKIALLALVVFVLDTVTNIDIVIPVLYVNVILLAMRSGRRSDVMAAGVGSIALTIVSFLITVDLRHTPTSAFINNSLSLLAIICVLILSLRIIRSQAEVIRARDRIATVSRRVTLKAMSTAMVHEVAQPISAIGVNADAALRWLAHSPPNLEETRAANSRIAAEIGRIVGIMDRLRLLVGHGGLSIEMCNLLHLIEDALNHFGHDIAEAQVDLALDCSELLTVTADKILMQQVFINLLTNALDALRAADVGQRNILIQATEVDAFVVVFVKDSGLVCTQTMIDQMFDPFFTTKSKSGMGIGLAVSRSIIEAHSGTIRAFANAPRGLVVEIALPKAGHQHE